MDLDRTLEQQAFVRQAIASGRMKHESEIIQEAFSLWESQERCRIEILTALDAAEADLEAGFFSDYTDETIPELAVNLKLEARALRAQDATR